jgi:uncharacterized protein (DUF1778 family)
MATNKGDVRQERLNLRLSATDDELIRAAAEAEQISITEFVLRAARASASQALADRRYVVLDAKTWDALDARLAKRTPHNQKLAELFRRPSPFAE